MQFLTSLFGGTGNSILTAILALGIVLVLIMLAVWGLKLLTRASGSAVRGRNRRLAIVDSLAIDPKRQLLIIRRDNVEHVILTGGQHDLVLETGIPVEAQQTRPPARRPVPLQGTQPAQTRATGPQAVVEPAMRGSINGRAAPAASTGDHLIAVGEAAAQKRSGSLRHTGLLRPVGRTEPEIGAAPAARTSANGSDSARTGHFNGSGNGRHQGDTIENEQADSGDTNQYGHRNDGRNPDRN